MSATTETVRPADANSGDPTVLLHDAEETSRRLGGVVSPRWLKRMAGEDRIPHRRLGKSFGWSDADIAQLIEDNYCDPRNYGRKRAS